MAASYERTGMLIGGQTIRLDEPLAIPSGRVRVIIEPMTSDTDTTDSAVERMHRDQAASGTLSPSNDLDAERKSWDR